MDGIGLIFFLFVALMVRELRVQRAGEDAVGRRRRRRQLITVLVMEATAQFRHSDAALYPTLSTEAGLFLSQGSACHRDTAQLHQALKNRTLWAERMIDASAKAVVGGLWGARFQLGSFDGCLSAGLTSPVGSRYCLAQMSAHPQPRPLNHSHGRPHFHNHHHPPTHCEELRDGMWDHVTSLNPYRDAWHGLQGCNLVPGSFPLGDVSVALCVPASCDPGSLEEALQFALQGTGFQVRVPEERCVGHREVEEIPLDTSALLFWALVATLTAIMTASSYLGLESWDWREHGKALVQPDRPLFGLDLSVLSGIRAINAILILGTHRAFNSAKQPTSNQLIYTAESRTSLWHALGHHAALLVDTCFFMSGLLMLLSCRQRKQRPLRALFNRYLRLTPSYALMMLFYATAMPSFGSGPLWKSTVLPESAACRGWWWSNVFYINNYVHPSEGEYSCMLQSWSLAVEMQLFVLGTLLVPLLPSTVSLSKLGVVLGLTTLPPFVLTLVQGWPPMMIWTGRALENPYADPLFYSMYVPTHTRAAPYVVGILAGHLMLRLKERNVVLGDCSRIAWGSLLVMFLVLESSVLFGDLTQPPSPLVAALYASLSPIVWSAAVGTLLVALVIGDDCAIAKMLRWQPLLVVSRLSYGVYLVHFAVQILQGGAERNPLHVTILTMFRSSFSDLIISLLISVWLFFAIEAPFRVIAKRILTGERRLSSPEEKRKEVLLRTSNTETHLAPDSAPELWQRRKSSFSGTTCNAFNF